MSIDLGFDESASSTGDTLIVGCQLAVTNAAKRFKSDYSARLGTLPYFHSKDFRNLTGGVFTKAGLDQNARTALLTDLCNLIHRQVVCGISAHVSVKEYERNTTHEFRSRFATAYAFLINVCMLKACDIVKKSGRRPHFNISSKRATAMQVRLETYLKCSRTSQTKLWPHDQMNGCQTFCLNSWPVMLEGGFVHPTGSCCA